VKAQVVIEPEARQFAFEQCELVGLIEQPHGLGDAVEVAVFPKKLEAE